MAGALHRRAGDRCDRGRRTRSKRAFPTRYSSRREAAARRSRSTSPAARHSCWRRSRHSSWCSSIFGTAVDQRGPKIGGLAIGFVVAADILAIGPLTGASMNPARSFGPAVASGVYEAQLLYWAAPITGALVAATAVRVPVHAAGTRAGGSRRAQPAQRESTRSGELRALTVAAGDSSTSR